MDWSLPDKTTFCLVGRGDSTKSTILEAIRRVFHPQWNLGFDDADFFQCAPENKINIEVILGNIPDEFKDLASYGGSLCGWSRETLRVHDEPGDSLEDVIRVRLTVGENLEPSWRVIKNDQDEGVAFKPNDRAKVAVSLIGTTSDRHLTWSRGSLLSRLTDADNMSSSLADASRAAKAAMETHRNDNLTKFDDVARIAETTARSLGVQVDSSYKANLDSDAINIRIGGLALHDGNVPLRQLGLGSKRMLLTGLQREGLREPHITLFDEVEIGLEPHRIARLLSHLKEDTTGQYFLTTHSPVVLRELTVDDLYIVHCRNAKIEIVEANKPGISDSVQGKIRSCAEAFLAPRVIVCEGATEVGFLRGLDSYWVSKGASSFAYQGLALFDANGASKVRQIAENLCELSYQVGVLADSDSPKEFGEADVDQLRRKGIAVTVWDGVMSIEDRVFADLPWSGAIASFDAACRIHGDLPRLLDQVGTQYGPGFDRDPSNWTDHVKLRTALGAAAKASEWFKRQSWAYDWATSIRGHLEDPAIREADLILKLNATREWIDSA